MIAAAHLTVALRRKVRSTATAVSVPGSLPVLFFGDAFNAEIATIGLNPSKFEYVDRDGTILAGKTQRFAMTTSFGVQSREQLSDGQADQAIDVMRSYYDRGKPVYGSYFRHLSNFLAGLDASYGSRIAAHLDLVQESTDPVWGGLSSEQRADLLNRDLPFLKWQIESLPRLKVVFCAGKTVSHQVQSQMTVHVTEAGTMKRIRWWHGVLRLPGREMPIGGWNYPLDRPTGLGKAGERELGELFAKALP